MLALDALGMSAPVLAMLRRALRQPNGIVLVTGPTGSGKTTSLYAGLGTLNDGERNILTIEDPVEYAIRGIGQTQVNSRVGMSFAAGLRAILRQDPDVVMVGEIRDAETAQIAVQASLTGHLVLSTVHTNDAAGAITRLRWPAGPGIRIESGVSEGDVVTPVFDPMLAKIVVTGSSRDQALARARRQHVVGVQQKDRVQVRVAP